MNLVSNMLQEQQHKSKDNVPLFFVLFLEFMEIIFLMNVSVVTEAELYVT